MSLTCESSAPTVIFCPKNNIENFTSSDDLITLQNDAFSYFEQSQENTALEVENIYNITELTDTSLQTAG